MEVKKRTHKIFDRFTIPCALALIIISIFVVSNLGTLLGIPVKNMTGNETLATAVGAVISSLLLLWLFKFWFRPEFEGNLRGGDLKLGMKLCLIFVVYWVTLVPLGFIFSSATFGPPTINTISLSVTAGVVEEVVFRGLPGSYLMRQWRDEKHILAVVLFTSVIFGVTHLANMFAGGNRESVMIQGFTATCTGIILCAIYLRSGNLLVTILIHTLHDIIALTDVSGIQNGVIVTGVDWSTWADVIANIILVGIAFWLLRPAKRGEVRAMWNKKWGILEEEEDKESL